MKINIPSIEDQEKIVKDLSKESYIRIECSKAEKTALIQHARKRGLKLGVWALDVLIEKMVEENGKNT